VLWDLLPGSHANTTKICVWCPQEGISQESSKLSKPVEEPRNQAIPGAMGTSSVIKTGCSWAVVEEIMWEIRRS
jgi:hypothetical protein